MNKKYVKLGLAAIMGATALTSGAVKATPRPITVAQPDGSELTIRVMGDERFHAAYTLDGDLIMRNAEGYFCYATIGADGYPEASTMRVNPLVKPLFGAADRENIDKALARKRQAIGDKPKYIFSGNPFPTTGEPHALVILVEYSDKSFSMKNPQEFFNNELNGENFTEYGATGSARDYFIRNSNGLFKPTFDVYGPVKLKNSMSYYGKNDYWTEEDMHPEEMVEEALTALDPTVDFSQYDHDGDGYIDNIYIFYAGYGEADSYKADTIWPHSADLIDFDLPELPQVDGVYANRYGMSNEVDYSYRRPDGIGTFVHEFSHVMGLPDLYHTEDSSNLYTPGDWSVLDSGPYNDQGRTPPNYSIHERYAMNWMEPQVLKYTGDYTLQPIDVSNAGYIIPTEKADEFYLLECRHLEGNDKFIPNAGMLVWHIDFDQDIWDQNKVNNNKNHQYVDLIEADNKTNTQKSDNSKGDSFPGTSNVTSFSFSTKPALKSWAGKDLGVALSNIKLNEDGTVSFHLEGETPSTGVEAISGESNVYSYQGVIYCNCETPANVYDLTGCRIGDVSAQSPLQTPAAGLYIVTLPTGSVKIMTR
ncbi:MAG: M6 family metalloprotease domain-containing protein [Clostridium sp.]|nr:M6 family metalloprotease domain-containing protein [Prevotella sp.]MCM1429408.1 M6 family metalloprotease domain-containing protein [Clostridium sp.]